MAKSAKSHKRAKKREAAKLHRLAAAKERLEGLFDQVKHQPDDLTEQDIGFARSVSSEWEEHDDRAIYHCAYVLSRTAGREANTVQFLVDVIDKTQDYFLREGAAHCLVRFCEQIEIGRDKIIETIERDLKDDQIMFLGREMSRLTDIAIQHGDAKARSYILNLLKLPVEQDGYDLRPDIASAVVRSYREKHGDGFGSEVGRSKVTEILEDPEAYL